MVRQGAPPHSDFPTLRSGVEVSQVNSEAVDRNTLKELTIDDFLQDKRKQRTPGPGWIQGAGGIPQRGDKKAQR